MFPFTEPDLSDHEHYTSGLELDLMCDVVFKGGEVPDLHPGY